MTSHADKHPTSPFSLGNQDTCRWYTLPPRLRPSCASCRYHHHPYTWWCSAKSQHFCSPYSWLSYRPSPWLHLGYWLGNALLPRLVVLWLDWHLRLPTKCPSNYRWHSNTSHWMNSRSHNRANSRLEKESDTQVSTYDCPKRNHRRVGDILAYLPPW